MHTKRIFLVFVLCFFTASINAGGSKTSPNPTHDADKLDAALQRGLNDPGIPFQLQVNCIDQKGVRSMELFAGGATIWNRLHQITLPAKARSALLKTLVSNQFSSFESRYGGHTSLEKTEAAARITCRVLVEIEGLEKSSVQQSGGEQSMLLASLATALLDEVEEYETGGVKPDNLQDALEMLNSGQLAPQVLRLRFVDLSEIKGVSTGAILQIRGGDISHQAYSPGRSVAGQDWHPMNPDQLPGLLANLQAAQLESLPGNVWWQEQAEFEIRVLGHKKVVIARPFARLRPGGQDGAQKRFASLVEALRGLNPQSLQP